MNAEKIAEQAAKDFYGAPGINEDWELWLTQKIEAYAHAKQREAWKEVNDAWAGGYLTFPYIAARLDDTGEPCPGCMGPCGQCD